MASTVTNKQPILPDRPFIFGSVLTTEINPRIATVTGNLVELIQLSSDADEDACWVEDVWVNSLNAGNTSANLNLYLYDPTASTVATTGGYMFLNEVAVTGATLDEHFALPFTMAPAPRVGSDAKNSAILLAPGQGLYASLDTATSASFGYAVFIQGFYA